MSAAVPETPPDFARLVIDWQARHGRHDLPWQGSRDPYRIWISEIMLQQTQVAAVIPFYQRFVQRFRTVAELAAAPLDEVLAHWSGLGYYARARNLHAAACDVLQRFEGRFPTVSADLQTLRGIGRSTAAAIAAFSSGERVAILDGNVKRVLARHFGVEGFPGTSAVEARLWALADTLLPDRGIEHYTQGLMDLGATVCTRSRPRCLACPLAASCVARATDRIGDLPSPRPRRARPTRSVTLWLLRVGDRVLLERRPPAGIWGGLWSLPEALPAPLAADPVVGPGYRLQHAFTHFLLSIKVEQRRWPEGLAALELPALGEPGPLRWFSLQEALAAGLPAPIRTVLRTEAESG